MYGGPDRVVDSCLREVVDGLRSPGTLPHVLCIIRCWFADMAKLKTALHRVKRTPTLLVWGDRDCTISLSSAVNLKRKLRASELIVLPSGGHSVRRSRTASCWNGLAAIHCRLRVCATCPELPLLPERPGAPPLPGVYRLRVKAVVWEATLPRSFVVICV
jgi:hypothetical protein